MKRVMVVAVAVIGWLVVYHRVVQQQEDALAAMQEAEEGLPLHSEAEATALRTAAMQDWHTACQLLESGDYAGSLRIYQRARRGLATVRSGPVAPGTSLETWPQEHDRTYRERLAREFENVLARLATGDVSHATVLAMLSSASQAGLPELADLFERAKDRIGRERARAASGWLRVTADVGPHYAPYADAVKDVCWERWPAGAAGKDLVCGRAMTEEERRATWKTLSVQIIEKQATCWFSRADGGQYTALLPQEVTVTFKMTGSENVPTNWDSLEPVCVATPLPESTGKFLDGGDDAVEKKAAEMRDALAALVRETLSARMQAFTVFPGGAVTRTPMLVGETLDVEAARAWAYRDRPGLVTELRKITQQADEKIHDALLLLIVSENLEELAPWVTQTLPSCKGRLASKVYQELCKRPWFGAYGPLCAVIEQGDEHAVQNAVTALRGHMHVEPVRGAVLGRIGDGHCAHRAPLAAAFIRDVPLDVTKPFAAAWVGGRDARLSECAFEAFAQADGTFAADLTLALFDTAPPRTRLAMVRQFAYDEARHGQRGVALLLGAFDQTDDAPLRRAAFDRIEAYAHSGPVWLALRRQVDVEKNQALRTPLLLRLVHTVRRACPDSAEAFLAAQLDAADRGLRKAAVHELLGSDAPKDTAIHAIAVRAGELGSDDGLLADALHAMHQYQRIRRNWDFAHDQVELNLLLFHGTHHPDKAVRALAYTIMGRAVEDGAAHLVNLLRNALNREEDPDLKRQILAALGVR